MARDTGLWAGPHLLCASAQYEVVSARTLVSCDELGDVDRGPRAQGLQVRPQLLLQPPIQYLRAPHRLSQVQRRYVPAWGGGTPSSSAQPRTWAPPGPAARPSPLPRAPPTVEHEVVGCHHGQQCAERHEHLLALGVQAQANGARLRQRAVVVGLLGGGRRGGVRWGVARATSRPGPRPAPSSSAFLLGASAQRSKPGQKPLPALEVPPTPGSPPAP